MSVPKRITFGIRNEDDGALGSIIARNGFRAAASFFGQSDGTAAIFPVRVSARKRPDLAQPETDKISTPARIRAQLPLAGVSVVECGQGVAAAFGAKLMVAVGRRGDQGRAA